VLQPPPLSIIATISINMEKEALAAIESGESKEEPAVVTAVDPIDDTKDDEDFDLLTLPESTHTLLFTEPIHSKAFLFSLAIASLSIMCLILALTNKVVTLDGMREIPGNVGHTVKIAQFASIFIALLMEEEIPTGLCLLRHIPKNYFKSKFPNLKYYKFVASCSLRILMGYIFLVSVMLLLMMADNVLDIFFDFIALQFLQQLDDVAFNLARMGVFSKSLRAATRNKYFQTELRRHTKVNGNRKISFFLKAIYFVNLVALLGAQIYVTVRQGNGDYQCKSITVRFKDEVWEKSLVQMPGEEMKEMALVYPYFNGIYNQDGTSNDGRPVYVEQNKFDGTSFDTASPDTGNMSVKIPAKIQYCKSIRAWVFLHEYIRKSTRDDSECPWLLRSEETEVYDIEEVQGPWQVWAGVIRKTDVEILCNECNDDADCNLNGVCKKDGKCECFDDVEGVQFIGSHCEVRIEDACKTIYGEEYNDTWSVALLGWGQGVFQEYDRPVYVYRGGHPLINDSESDAVFLLYSGDRWFGIYQPGGKLLFGENFQIIVEDAVTNYHAFWDRAYTTGTVISDAQLRM